MSNGRDRRGKPHDADTRTAVRCGTTHDPYGTSAPATLSRKTFDTALAAHD